MLTPPLIPPQGGNLTIVPLRGLHGCTHQTPTTNNQQSTTNLPKSQQKQAFNRHFDCFVFFSSNGMDFDL